MFGAVILFAFMGVSVSSVGLKIGCLHLEAFAAE